MKLSSSWLGKASALIAFWSWGFFFIPSVWWWNFVELRFCWISEGCEVGGSWGRELDFWRRGSLKTNSVLQEWFWAQFG
jgi:hypothetical protein